ncbi:hypothetical protein [Cytobacillus horneckiae]|uniref:hypothetical protein n=1 Tax=Cytobacillus horneckiae TaxID=549687 RepID=UPI003D9A9C24
MSNELLKKELDKNQGLTEKEKEDVINAWKNIKGSLAYAFYAIEQKLREAVKRLLAAWKSIEEEAKEGNPEAIYLIAESNISYWRDRLKENEAKLKVTKKSVPRKKLFEEKKNIQEAIEKNLAEIEKLEKESLEELEQLEKEEEEL